MNVSPAVSVVIPTLNRKGDLLNAVAELLAAPSRHMLELIVIDQSAEPAPELDRHADPRLVYRHVDFRSLPRARNTGIAAARGDIVLFLDDDVAGLARVVDAHAEVHRRTGADVVTGPTPAPGQRLVAPASLTHKERIDIGFGWRLHPTLDAEYNPLFAPGCNCSFARDVFRRCGGFDENFIGNAVGEDAEMSYRVKLDFGRIVSSPAAAITHLNTETGGCRDEADMTRRLATTVLNTHYLNHKTGQTQLFVPGLWRLMRTHAVNGSMLRPATLPVALRRVAALLKAWREARVRTARLLDDTSAPPATDPLAERNS